MHFAQSTRHTHRRQPHTLIRTETLQRPSRLKLHCSVYWPLEVWGELTNPSAPVPLISHPGARVQLHITTTSSYVGAGELNLGPHAVKTNPVPIKLSPQRNLFFRGFWGPTRSSCVQRKLLPTQLSPSASSLLPLLCYAEVHTLQVVTWGSVPSLSSPPCLSFVIAFCFVILTSCFLMTPAVLRIWPMESGSNVTSAAHKAPIRWTWEI